MIFLKFLLYSGILIFSLMMAWTTGKFIFVAINHWTDCSNTKDEAMQILLMAVLTFVYFMLIIWRI